MGQNILKYIIDIAQNTNSVRDRSEGSDTNIKITITM